jgi:hypothetical protein
MEDQKDLMVRASVQSPLLHQPLSQVGASFGGILEALTFMRVPAFALGFASPSEVSFEAYLDNVTEACAGVEELEGKSPEEAAAAILARAVQHAEGL